MTETEIPRTAHITIRVRYAECDPMGVAHHSAYLPWFEMGRTELLRLSGISYREFETQGVLMAVAKLGVVYKRPALYDDELTLETGITRVGMAKIEHAYRLLRGDDLLATAESTLACLDRNGAVQPLPEFLRGP